MSGGSWQYFYGQLEDIATRLQSERDPVRKAFGSHLQLCAKALHDIEWVDSGDYGEKREVESIRMALGKDASVAVLSETIKQVESALVDLKNEIERSKQP